jgi:hypothetical protein
VVRYMNTYIPADTIFSSLASDRGSKVKRLAIPLVLRANPSRKRFDTLGSLDVRGDSLPPTSGVVAACPWLTEFTIICHPDTIEDTEKGHPLDPVGRVRSVTSELVNARKALPDFDTLQTTRFPPPMSRMICGRVPMDGVQDRRARLL